MTKINAEVLRSPVKIMLFWRKPPFALKVGQTWSLPLKLKPIHGMANPGSFNQEQFRYEQKIRATANVYRHDNINLLAYQPEKYPVAWLRENIATYLRQSLPHHPGLGFLLAISIGEQYAITADTWPILQNTGTNHLVAIAGLHLGMVVSAVWWLSQKIWRLSKIACLRYPAQRFSLWISLLALWSYAALSGLSIATERATLMMTLLFWLQIRQRHVFVSNTVLLALLLILICNPFAPLSFTFWLSFTSVFFLIAAAISSHHSQHSLVKSLQPQWIISIGLIPLMIIFFHQLSVLSLLANFIAIPWVGFLILPLLFFSFFLLPFSSAIAAICLHITANLASNLLDFLHYLANLPLTNYHCQLSVMNSILFFISTFFWLTTRHWPGRHIVLFSLLPLLKNSTQQNIALGQVTLNILDVGEGLATVVRTMKHTLIFDTGPRWQEGSDAGNRVVLPFLYQAGIKYVDKLIISHPDIDHSGGAFSILRGIQVNSITGSAPEKLYPYTAHWCLANQQWQWDGVQFTFLYPSLSQLGLDNNSSCVLQIKTQQQTILLTGDIEKRAEQWLMQHQENKLATTVLVVPHHGSRTSSTQPFLKKVHPQLALFSYGYLNRFHLPNSKVVERYQQLGSNLFNTVDCGEVTVILKERGGSPLISCYRQEHKRYWQWHKE